jgi:hypothetical protein
MARKFRTKPEGMDGQRHDRFVARMQQIGVLEDVKNFEKAFQKAFKSAFANAAGRRRPAGRRTNGVADERSADRI